MALSARDLIEQARQRVPEVPPQDLWASQDQGGARQLIDVRESDEVTQGLLPGAVHIPRGVLEMSVEAATELTTTMALFRK